MNKRYLMGLALAASAVFAHITESHAAEPAYAPQVSNGSGVKVTATLQAIPGDAKTWNFELSMETHTHPLNEAMENASVLIADGKQYQPTGWEGTPPGGHHRKGILRFKAVSPLPASAELQIRLSGEASPRSFKWQLK